MEDTLRLASFTSFIFSKKRQILLETYFLSLCIFIFVLDTPHGMQDPSFLTRDQIWALSSGSSVHGGPIRHNWAINTFTYPPYYSWSRLTTQKERKQTMRAAGEINLVIFSRFRQPWKIGTQENGWHAFTAPCRGHDSGLDLIHLIRLEVQQTKNMLLCEILCYTKLLFLQAGMENDDHFIIYLSTLLMPFKRLRASCPIISSTLPF